MPARIEGLPRWRNSLYIQEAGHRVGVRPSALRFWEEQELLQPRRDPESQYRLYDEAQLRKLQIIVLLRKADYDFKEIRTVLLQMEHGNIEQALVAAPKRLRELNDVSRSRMIATAMLWSYIESDISEKQL